MGCDAVIIYYIYKKNGFVSQKIQNRSTEFS